MTFLESIKKLRLQDQQVTRCLGRHRCLWGEIKSSICLPEADNTRYHLSLEEDAATFFF